MLKVSWEKDLLLQSDFLPLARIIFFKTTVTSLANVLLELIKLTK